MQFWQNFQKKKKHHIFSDSALQLADDIFTVAVDYDMDDDDEEEEVSHLTKLLSNLIHLPVKIQNFGEHLRLELL